MRVLIVITKGELGGAQTHVLELCRMLHRRIEFRVMVGGADGSPLQLALSSLGVPVEPVPGLGNQASPSAVLASVRQVAAAARRWEADLLHVHSAAAAAVGRVAAWMVGRPVLYTVHGFGFKPQVAPARRWAVLTAERLLAVVTAQYICVSLAERHLASRLWVRDSRITVIGNGVGDVPARAAPEAGDPAVIMVARAANPKRHDLLLHALAVLARRGVKVPRTVFVGAGPHLEQAQATARQCHLDAVSFVGDVSDVQERLARSHIFVLLSDHEGQPISIIEAMRAGLPVLASDLPGIRTQVTHGVEGLLTENDPAAVAEALQRLVGDPLLRARMGVAARARYEQEFSASTMASRVEGVYDGFAGRHPRLLRPPVH